MLGSHNVCGAGMSYIGPLTDSDYGLLLRCLWAQGGGARGSDAAHERLISNGLAEKKGINRETHNENIYGERLNITAKGRRFLMNGGKE